MEVLAGEQMGMGDTCELKVSSTRISVFVYASQRSICYINHGSPSMLLDPGAGSGLRS